MERLNDQIKIEKTVDSGENTLYCKVTLLGSKLGYYATEEAAEKAKKDYIREVRRKKLIRKPQNKNIRI